MPARRARRVCNAEATGRVLLKQRTIREFALSAIPDEQKPAILKEYLDRFNTTVQRYFPLAQVRQPPSSRAWFFTRYSSYGRQENNDDSFR